MSLRSLTWERRRGGGLPTRVGDPRYNKKDAAVRRRLGRIELNNRSGRFDYRLLLTIGHRRNRRHRGGSGAVANGTGLWLLGKELDEV